MQLTEIIIPVASLAGLGLAMATILLSALKVFHVEEDPLIDEVDALLPQANCGGCGFPGCRNFAEELVREKDPELFCPVAGIEGMAQIYRLLGVEAGGGEPRVSRIRCHGTTDNAIFLAKYVGVSDCLAAALVDGVERSCAAACFGLGTCVDACNFDAMNIEDGIVKVTESRCTGCGACVKACPQDLCVLVPVDKHVFVRCNNTDPGAMAKKGCKVACIGCKRCVKACGYDAVSVKDKLAAIATDKCTLCGDCIEACPTGSIVALGVLPERADQGENKEEKQDAGS